MNDKTRAVLESRAKWLKMAKEQLVETQAEVELFERSESHWESRFLMPFPGPGYASTMRAQAARLREEIARHERADAESSAYQAVERLLK